MSITLLCLLPVFTIRANAQTIDGTQKICTTAYTADPTAKTASGERVREGICAAADKYLYDSEFFNDDPGTWVAMIWTTDGEFLGYFEVLDRGGTEAIRSKGTVIDIYCDTYEKCVEWMEITQGKCLVKYVKAVG